MKPDDVEFMGDMVLQLDQTIQNLVVEQQMLVDRLGEVRVEELKEFWEQQLSLEEEAEFKRTIDYWDKILLQNWAHLNRVHNSRAEVGKTFMKLNSTL